jgi:hypothetical protein
MAKKLTQEELLERAKLAHGDKYDYSKVNYLNARNKVTIICKEHGEFQQSLNIHAKGTGCKKCATLLRTTEEFIEKAISIHGDKYLYDKVDYTGKDEKVEIFCKKHGYFKQTANAHLRGANCAICARINTIAKRTKTTEQFIKEVKEVHGDRYSYDEVEYVGSHIKIKIKCEKHGVFEQTPSNHLQGTNCPNCTVLQTPNWRRTDFIKKANGRICTFYTIRCFNNEESFYKIGITMRSIKDRYPGVDTMPYSYEIVSEVFGEAGFIWDLEKEEKRKLKEFHYTPNLDFKGSKTECFTQYNKDA